MKAITRSVVAVTVLGSQVIADHCGFHGVATLAMLALVPVAGWAIGAFARETTPTTAHPVTSAIPDTIITGQYAPTRVV